MSSGELFPPPVRPDPHPFQLFCPCIACCDTLQYLKGEVHGPLMQAYSQTFEEDTVKALVDGWDEQKQALVYKYLYLMGMRIDKAESVLRKAGKK